MNEPTRTPEAITTGRTKRVGRHGGWLPTLARLARIVVPLAIVAACATVEPPTVQVRLDLVSQVPMRAGEVELVRPAGTATVNVVPLRSDLLVRAAVVGDRVQIAWVAPESEAGPQVRLEFDASAELEEDPVIVRAMVLGSTTGPDLGAGVLAWRNSGLAPVSGSPLSTPRWEHDPILLAWFAEHPLGDLDESGDLDVRDALLLLDLLRFGNWSDFGRYHGDLDADGGSDVADLVRLLERLVDRTLPPVLDVRPAEISFVQLDPATDRDAIVLIANGGGGDLTVVDWEDVPPGISLEHVGGLEGRSAALRLTLEAPDRHGWRPGYLGVTLGPQTAKVRLGHLVVLVAGQSNAQGRGANLDDWPHVASATVRMLGNDYRWRDAREPLDDGAGQVDDVSFDNIVRYSFGTRLGERLHEATGFQTYLIPAALGGSKIFVWLPGDDPLDRTNTLFGSANYRSQVSAGLQPNPIAQTLPALPSEGGPVTAVAWYQGESDAIDRGRFVDRTSKVFTAFHDELGAPVVYVQLAGHYLEQLHVQQHAIAELQRRMEAGFGDLAAPPDAYMVVAFDLPRSDRIHLSAFGLRLLAERIELAVREHVLGEDVDGTGPRLSAITHSGGTVVRLHTTRALSDEALDRELFTVYDGEPSGSLDDVTTYGANEIPIESVVRDPTDARAVRITLTASAAGAPHVRYMGRPGLLPSVSNNNPSHPEVWEIVAPGVVRAAAGGLPLPTFGPLAPFGTP